MWNDLQSRGVFVALFLSLAVPMAGAVLATILVPNEFWMQDRFVAPLLMVAGCVWAIACFCYGLGCLSSSPLNGAE